MSSGSGPEGSRDPSDSPASSTPKVKLVRTPFARGELIGDRYEIEGVVGEGGMAVIVAAKHLELEERVAIKFLKDKFADDPEIVGRFAREAKAVAKLKSEYTATVYDVGVSVERGPYIVMEFLEGEDLERVLRREQRFPVALATEIIIQASVAITVAHAHSIVHRDIKPANLFVVRKEHGPPRVKVLDFGISKATLTGSVFGGAMSLVATQSLLGTPTYMSPEQLRKGVGIQVTSDIWSLGVCLYEFVTGKTPFSGATVIDLSLAVCESTPVPASTLAPDVPAGLSDVIMKCLVKDPAARWQSVADFVVALAPWAPKRVQSCVDQIVSISKSAGLVRADFRHGSWSSIPPSGLEQITEAPASRNSQQLVGLPRINNTLDETLGSDVPTGTLRTGPRPARKPNEPVDDTIGAGTASSATTPASKRSRSFVVALGLVGLVIAAILYMRMTKPLPPTADTSSSSAPSRSDAPAASTTPPVPATPAPAESLEGRWPDPEPAAKPSSSVAAAVLSSPPRGHDVRPTKTPPGSSTRRPSNAPDCSVPFFVDSSGIRRVRPECF